MNNDIINELYKMPNNAALLLAGDLQLFIKVFHWYIYRQDFIFKDFHKKIIAKLTAIAESENVKPNLAICMPPRVGKSLLLKYFVAWSYARNRESNFIYTSYSDLLIQRFSAEIRDLIDSELFKTLFGIELKQDSKSKSLWRIENGGGLLAAPIAGGITGFGAGSLSDDFSGALVIDDPLNAENYNSATERQNCIDRYINKLESRRENTDKTPIILVMQRLHIDDLAGYLMKSEGEKWDFLILPAYDEATKTSIFPEKITAEYLENIKQYKPYLYNSQYQQTPIILNGGIIKREWFKFYHDTNIAFNRVFITADTAQEVNEWNDYTAIGVWGLTNNNTLYLLDLIHGKFEAPELTSAFCALWDKWRQGINGRPCSAVIIEKKASGTGLIQELKRKKAMPIMPTIPTKDKLSRVMDIIGYIAAGCVYLPESETNSISATLLAESDAFSADMKHSHDDIIDCMTYAVNEAFNRKGLF